MIVEIKARFDEQANIRWARKLEQAGCHVVYGIVGLKTHCKLAMVVREEPDGIQRYTHIGTGNYNPKTARMYEDFGLLTTDEAIGEDVAHLFNNLSGWSRNASYDQLMVAPDSVRSGLIERIRAEVDNHHAGLPARVRIKANSIVDERDHRRALPRLTGRRTGGPADPRDLLGASGRPRASARPSGCARCSDGSSSTAGSSGSRTAANPAAYIGSADMMHRNLDRRVEVLVRLPHADLVAEVGRRARQGVRPGHGGVGARVRRDVDRGEVARRRAAGRPAGAAVVATAGGTDAARARGRGRLSRSRTAPDRG